MSAAALTLRERVGLMFSSAFGLGYSPVAPGTCGTFAGLPLWWLMCAWPVLWQVGFVALFTLFAIWMANIAEEVYDEHDSGKIVIDEVAGVLTAAIAMPFEPVWVVTVFLCFRFFDIVKPPPIRTIDRDLGGGAGVILDDTAAGVMALAVVHSARALLA